MSWWKNIEDESILVDLIREMDQAQTRVSWKTGQLAAAVDDLKAQVEDLSREVTVQYHATDKLRAALELSQSAPIVAPDHEPEAS